MWHGQTTRSDSKIHSGMRQFYIFFILLCCLLPPPLPCQFGISPGKDLKWRISFSTVIRIVFSSGQYCRGRITAWETV